MVKITSPAPGAGRGQARPAVSPALLAALAGRLTARDRWLLRMLLEHRVLTTTQITDLAYGGPRRAALRLSELYRLRAVDRFRPLAAAGSSPYHWVLDQAGAEVLAAEDGVPLARLGYRRDRALDIAFSPRLAHTWGPTACSSRSPAPPAAAAASWPAGGPNGAAPRCGATWPAPTGTGCGATPAARAPTSSSSTTPAAKTCPAWPPSSPGTASWRAGRRSPPRSCSGWPPARTGSSSSAPCSPRPGRSPASRWSPPPPPRPRPPAGPAGAAWLPAWQSGPRLRPGQLAAAVPGARPAAQPPAGDTGLAWHPPVPHPPPAAGFGGTRPGEQGRAVTGRRIAACALAAVLAAGCAACTSWQPRQAGRPSHAASSPPATPAAAGTPALAAILPFSPARLQAAAVAAGRFTASWDSWSWRQSPAAWLARLLPLAAAELRPALAQAAGTPGVLAQRDATRQAATATASRRADPGPDPRLGHRRRHRPAGHHQHQRHHPGGHQLRGHPHPARHRLGRLGHRARQRREQLKGGRAMTSPRRRPRLGCHHAGRRRRRAAADRHPDRRGRRDHRAAGRRLPGPARRQHRRRVHPRQLPRRLRESRRRVRHPVDGARRDRDRRERQRPVDRAGRAFRHQPLRGGRADAVRRRRRGRRHLGRRPRPPRLRAHQRVRDRRRRRRHRRRLRPRRRHPLRRLVPPGPRRPSRHCRPRCSPSTTPPPTSATSWLGRPVLRRRRSGGLGRQQPAVPASRRRAAARRDRRQGHRLRRGPARQALPVGGHRPGRLRLLRAGHDGLPGRRHQHPADLPRAVAVRHADPAIRPRSQATWCSSPAATGRRRRRDTSAS